jgi:hypothetical protein
VYGIHIWKKKHIDAIENVQRHFTKRIPALSELTYPERLALLDLEPLELRRLKFDLIQYYIILNKLSPIQFDDYFQLCAFNQSTCSSNPTRLLKNVSGPDYLYYNFFNRSIEFWNALPVSVIIAHP